MVSSLSNLADNLAEELPKGNCMDFIISCFKYANIKYGVLLFKFMDRKKVILRFSH